MLSWLAQVPRYVLTVYICKILLLLPLWAVFLASLITYPLSVGRLGRTMRAKDFPVQGWSDAGGMVVLMTAIPFVGSTFSLLFFIPMGVAKPPLGLTGPAPTRKREGLQSRFT